MTLLQDCLNNSEANASEFLDNLEEMFLQYCIHNDFDIMFSDIYLARPYYVTSIERFEYYRYEIDILSQIYIYI